jgi:hypothetical protein
MINLRIETHSWYEMGVNMYQFSKLVIYPAEILLTPKVTIP